MGGFQKTLFFSQKLKRLVCHLCLKSQQIPNFFLKKSGRMRTFLLQKSQHVRTRFHKPKTMGSHYFMIFPSQN